MLDPGERVPAIWIRLFEALRPEGIGVHLTEGDMMDLEASVSALVFPPTPGAIRFAGIWAGKRLGKP